MKITVYGAGYVGLVTAACFAELGHEVLCIDINIEKIKLLEQGKIPYYEPGLSNLVQNNIKRDRLFFSGCVTEGVDFAKMQFICVGTPANKDGSADTTAIFAVLKVIAKSMRDFRIIVNKSTVPLGTNEKVEQFLKVLLKLRGVSCNFAVVSNPEFLQEGRAIDNFMHPDRVIIGTKSDDAARLMKKLYEPLCDKQRPFIHMDPVSSELTKYSANAMLATKISFINEIANLAEYVGADIKLVQKGIAYDPRIGPHFINAGAGYGGSCFPKDVKALIYSAQQLGLDPKVLSAVEIRNAQQREYLFTKINKHFNNTLKDRVFAFWGLAFKPETDDMREASSCYLLDKLLAAKAQIQAYDPMAIPTAKLLYAKYNGLQFCENASACLDNADALIVITEWEDFRNPDFSLIKSKLKQPIIFDGRNLYHPEKLATLGFYYYGIGHGSKPKFES